MYPTRLGKGRRAAGRVGNVDGAGQRLKSIVGFETKGRVIEMGICRSAEGGRVANAVIGQSDGVMRSV